jgi:PKHD-type hydroxylase
MKHLWYYYLNTINKKDIINLNKVINQNHNCLLEDVKALKANKVCEVKIIQWKFVKHILKEIESLIYNTNKHIFGFNTHQINDFDYVNHNTYDSKQKGHYDLHMDSEDWNKHIYTFKLTCLLNISEDKYEGGEFVIFDGKEHLINEFNTPGSLLIFPSFMYHGVKPVTKGIRKSLAIWLTGNHWQ